MWICPKCNRSFKNTNQIHTCKLVTKASILGKRSQHISDLYETLIQEVKKFGDFREEAVLPDVFFLKTKSTFLMVKAKTKWIDVEFFLEKLEDVPPVKKYLQTSKRRVVHVVSIDSEEDIDEQLIDWLRRSYELIANA